MLTYLAIDMTSDDLGVLCFKEFLGDLRVRMYSLQQCNGIVMAMVVLQSMALSWQWWLMALSWQ